MESISAFFDMGGYAVFVWPAFAVTFGLMGLLVWQSRRRLRQAERALQALEQAGAPAHEDDAP